MGQNSPHNLRSQAFPLHSPLPSVSLGEGPSSINHVLQRRVNRTDLINLIIRGRGRESLPNRGRGRGNNFSRKNFSVPDIGASSPRSIDFKTVRKGIFISLKRDSSGKCRTF